MPYKRGDVVKLRTRGLEPGGGREHFAVVLSEQTYNDQHDHGVFAMIASDPPDGGELGSYELSDYAHLGLEYASYVVPWIWTLRWHRVIRKTGELTPYQLRMAVAELRKVASI